MVVTAIMLSLYLTMFLFPGYDFPEVDEIFFLPYLTCGNFKISVVKTVVTCYLNNT